MLREAVFSAIFLSMPKRAYVALPLQLTPEVEKIAEALGMTVNQFGVRCVEGCLAAIYGEVPTTIPIVRHARRIVRKELSAGDRLLIAMLEKAIPELPEHNERLRELLIEETNAIEGELTDEQLRMAHAMAMTRWKAEEKKIKFQEPAGKPGKTEPHRRRAKTGN
jgi:hypothetical protein